MKYTNKIFLLASISLIGINAISAKPNKKKKVIKKSVQIKNKLLDDFINRKSYIRGDDLVNIPSPFRNLIQAEQIRIRKIKEKADLLATQVENDKKNDGVKIVEDKPAQSVENQPVVDKEVAKHEAIQIVKKNMKNVDGYADLREYAKAEVLLSQLLSKIAKHDAVNIKNKLIKRKKEIEQEHADWDQINRIINGLTVDAMFMAKGKRKIALINNNAVEEGDDLNDILNLSKIPPIKLNFVSNNSITLQYKKFTLKKDLIDNDL